MATYIVLLGPPGVGKGTQAKILSEQSGLAHISSGDLFRENLKNQTELGKLAQTYMTKGELVPDDVTIAMIRERLSRPDCKAGAILDGFPRTPAQAEALEAMLQEFGGHVDVVPFVTDDDKSETVKHRIEVYFNQTLPLISYYRDHDKLVEIDGTRSIDQVTQDLLTAVNK